MLVLGRGSIFFFLALTALKVWGGGERGAVATASRAGLGEAGSGVESAGWGNVAACGEKVGMGTEYCRGFHEYGSVYHCSLLCFLLKVTILSCCAQPQWFCEVIHAESASMLAIVIYIRSTASFFEKKKEKVKHCGSASRGDFSENFRHQLYIK